MSKKVGCPIKKDLINATLLVLKGDEDTWIDSVLETSLFKTKDGTYSALIDGKNYTGLSTDNFVESPGVKIRILLLEKEK